jgi:hypothetical protein
VPRYSLRIQTSLLIRGIQFRWDRKVESRLGAVASELRFPTPLIEPCMRISRTRLSDWIHPMAHGGGPR